MQKSVLIVEDNELNMKLFNDLLEAHGYLTVQTRSGVEAVELARTHRPDLILMDIQLPEVSGLQVTQWIKDDETPPYSGDRHYRLRNEGGRGKNPSGRLRSLFFFATHFGGQIHRDYPPFPRQSVKDPR